MTPSRTIPIAKTAAAALGGSSRSEGARPAPHPCVDSLLHPLALGVGYAAARRGQHRASNPYLVGRPNEDPQAAQLWEAGFRVGAPGPSFPCREGSERNREPL